MPGEKLNSFNFENKELEPKQELITEKNIELITPKEFDELPDGTELYSITGRRVIKGVDEINQDTRNGCLAYGLKYDPESLKTKELRIWLITPEQLAELPDGTKFIDINGEEVVKGSKETDQETMGGYLPFGFTEESKPEGMDFKEGSLYESEEDS